MTEQQPQGGSHVGIRLPHAAHLSQGLHPTRDLAHVLRRFVVLGFLGSTQIDGVSSLCRFWHLDTSGYLALLHFFRSSAWSLTGLLPCWWAFVWSQQRTVMVEGQAVLIGDHTMTAKDGRRMPGVVTLHQDSETQSKPTSSRYRGPGSDRWSWATISTTAYRITSRRCNDSARKWRGCGSAVSRGGAIKATSPGIVWSGTLTSGSRSPVFIIRIPTNGLAV